MIFNDFKEYCLIFLLDVFLNQYKIYVKEYSTYYNREL